MNLSEAFVALRQKLPDHEHIMRRLDRAYDMIRMPGYEITLQGDNAVLPCEKVYKVEKLSSSLLSDESAEYLTSTQHCTCPDWEKAPAQLCKHVLAVTLLEMMEGE